MTTEPEGQATQRKRQPSAWGAVIAGVVMALVAVGGPVVRWHQAEQRGDVAQAKYLGRCMAIGIPSSALAIALGVMVLLLLPCVGLVRVRRLRSRFPERLTLPISRPTDFEGLLGTLLPTRQYVATFSFTLVADASGIELWGGVLRYRVRGRVSWGSIESIQVKEWRRKTSYLYLVSLGSPDWPVPFDVHVVSSPWTLSFVSPLGPASVAVSTLKSLWRPSNETPRDVG